MIMSGRISPQVPDEDVIIERSGITDRVQIIRRKEIPSDQKPRTLVAAYCRVSTDLEEQQKSLDHQMTSYKQIILEHPGWELAGIYADPGVTGTSVKKRKEFLRMIEDAQAGKIDRILAKSTSRFARNTEDMLKYTRMLRSIGVGVYFEKEKIDTLQSSSEMLLTIYAAFSQEESHDLSESAKAAFRMRAKQGKAQFSRLYGYTSTKKEKWIIVPEEAEVVKRIYDLYMKGFTVNEISGILTSENIPTPKKALSGWLPTSVGSILKNEKYAGDFLIQKTYTEDHLTHRRRSNRDMTLPQYFVEKNHTPIVCRETYDEVQLISKLREKTGCFSLYPYYGFLFCPLCGEKLAACSLETASRPRAWFCPGPSQEGKTVRSKRSSCPPFVIFESLLNEVMLKAMLNLRDDDFSPETQRELPFIRERIRQTGKVERWFLKILVSHITLADGQSVKILWSNGKQTILDMNIQEDRKHPLPQVDAIRENKTVFGGVDLQNDMFVRVQQGIQLQNEYINSLILEQAKDASLPKVKRKNQ